MPLKVLCPDSRLHGFKGMIFCRRYRHCWFVMVPFILVRPMWSWLLHTVRLRYSYIFQESVAYPRLCVEFQGLIISYSPCSRIHRDGKWLHCYTTGNLWWRVIPHELQEALRSALFWDVANLRCVRSQKSGSHLHHGGSLTLLTVRSQARIHFSVCNTSNLRVHDVMEIRRMVSIEVLWILRDWSRSVTDIP